MYPDDRHMHGLCVDGSGRIVAASAHRALWKTALLVPEFDLAPRLVSQKVVPNPPLPPVQVQLDNSHNEELIVRLIDETEPAQPQELRIAPGQQVGRHQLDEKQVAIVFTGALDVTLNGPEDSVAVHVATGECYSTPPGIWRTLAAAGTEPVEVALVTAGDGRKRVTWAPKIVQAAMAAGSGIDHNGYVAPLDLLPPPTRAAVAGRMMQAAE